MKVKKIMILGASILQIPAITSAKKMGYYVIAVDYNIEAVGLPLADESLIVSTNDTKNILKYARSNRIDGILTIATDQPVRTIAVICNNLRLPGLSIESSICATDKYQMRNRLDQNSIPIPMFFKAKNLQDCLWIANRLNNHVIVKPTDSSGSRGVSLANGRKAIEKAFVKAFEISPSGSVIVEEYLSGKEISVEAIAFLGKVKICAITDKRTTSQPQFVEMGHSQPAQLDEKTYKEICELTTDTIRAIGIENGPSHTEIMLTKEGPKVIEIGARLGGDFISTHLTPLSTGIDMVKNSIKIAMGESPDMAQDFSRASNISYFVTKTGTIHSIRGIKQAMKIRGVYDIKMFKRKGDFVTDLLSSTDRVGCVISSGPTVEEAILAGDEAMSLIEIKVE